MSKQLSDAPLRSDEPIPATPSGALPPTQGKPRAVFWPWLGGLLLVGMVIVGIVAFIASNWLNTLQTSGGVEPRTASLSSVVVQRSAQYADLTITLLNIQRATSFRDDPIHSGPAIVRATVQVHNPTHGTISITYYDIARLLVPGQQPVAPANVNLSAAPKAGTTYTGWIDFPLTSNVALNTLKLRFGNTSLNETLVTIPVSGRYDANQYSDHSYKQSLVIYYNYGPAGQYQLVYHLDSVDVRDSYNGVEVQAGRQFYVFNFRVDNPNNVWVAPGYGYDYIRLLLASSTPPMDNTLPLGFQHNSYGVSGHVTYQAPAGLHNLTLAFLVQFSAGQSTYSISL